MSKSKSRRRVTNDNANRRLPPSTATSSHRIRSTAGGLRLFEDRRQWHPEGRNAPARSFSRSRHRLQAVDRNQPAPRQKVPQKNLDRFAHLRSFPSQTRALIAFQEPSKVLVCVRRKQRQEVLHAKGKAGKRGQKKPRYGPYSAISCKGKK